MKFAFDPGKSHFGFAYWTDTGEFRHAGAVMFRRHVDVRLIPFPIKPGSVAVIEIPQVYRGTSKGDPADLIDVAITAGALASFIPSTFVRPHDWKGSVPKALHQARIRDALSPAEARLVERLPKLVQSHALDAIGLGKWAILNGRL